MEGTDGQTDGTEAFLYPPLTFVEGNKKVRIIIHIHLSNAQSI